MAEYTVNKGIDAPAEIGGLTLGWLLPLCVAWVIVLVTVILSCLAGAAPLSCVTIGLSVALCLGAVAFRLSAGYGEHGLMKRQTRRRIPRCLISRKPVRQMVRIQTARHREKETTTMIAAT